MAMMTRAITGRGNGALVSDIASRFAVSCLLSIACASPALGQSPLMPSDDALNKAMKATQRRAATVMDELGKTGNGALPLAVAGQRGMPKLNGSEGFDPAALAEKYRTMKDAASKAAKDSNELMVFVSLSMPAASLKRIGEQAKKAGAVVVFRGLKYGLRKGAWADSMNALKPIADTGADVQINPELFERFHVQVVPTLVVASSAPEGCQGNQCEAGSVAVVGDVSMDYALETLSPRKDAIGRIAQERNARIKGR
ncbi:MAG: type-F conjugative transfer system pilin assembly protein TrbC [Burkholderiales bacterium]|nr:type-F conjugative transfer system pilin assembly protein TrbC [Burkholderiales bacterium]